MKLLSFLKDSNDLIRTLQELHMEVGRIMMATMDVTALYTNIDHKKGLDCVGYVLEKELEIPERQQNFLLEALHFLLNNNCFRYGI